MRLHYIAIKSRMVIHCGHVLEDIYMYNTYSPFHIDMIVQVTMYCSHTEEY